MNAPGLDMAEFTDMDAVFFPGDAIPASLCSLLRYVSEEYLAEISAHADFINAHLAASPDLRDGDIVGGKANKRSLGRTDVSWRGMTLSVGVFPYRIYLLQRIQDAYRRRDATGQAEIRDLLGSTGLSPLLDIKTAMRVDRRNNREVWSNVA
jgi:hypothetical protein